MSALSGLLKDLDLETLGVASWAIPILDLPHPHQRSMHAPSHGVGPRCCGLCVWQLG